MKIVQINAVVEYSSTGRTTSELHKVLKDAGHQSWVAAPNAIDSLESIKIGDKSDHKVHSIISRVFGRQGYASYFSTLKLIKRLKHIDPDIIHLRNLHANYINLPLLFKYLSRNRIPVVITLHDCWFFTGHCCYFTDTNCDRWKMGCGNCPDLKNWNTSLFFDRTRSNLQDKAKFFASLSKLAVVGVSKWVTNFVPYSILKSAQIIKPIYNWIDTELFSPKKTNLRQTLGLEDDKIILCVAQTWNRQKGIDDIIKLANILPSFKFLLIGNVDSSVQLPINIISIGAVNDASKLANYYSIADVFFNPSIRETFGKVTVEALSCGTPVVAYNATATPELVPKNCGILVEIGDLYNVASAIERIVSNKSIRTECREFAVKTFSKDIIIRQYLELYEQILHG